MSGLSDLQDAATCVVRRRGVTPEWAWQLIVMAHLTWRVRELTVAITWTGRATPEAK